MPFPSSRESGSAWFARALATHPYLRRLAFSIACWSGVVVLESSQVFVSDASRGYVLPSLHYVAWAVFNWFALALLTPTIYGLGWRYPVTGSRWAWRFVFPHAALCLACLFTQAICRGLRDGFTH